MSENTDPYDTDAVRQRILTVRKQKVILDTDLASLYGVEVKRLNEQVKRNRDRFPIDFAFQLTANEFSDLQSQNMIAASKNMWSQIATTSSKRRKTNPPYAFTEHGAIMAATVLNSPRAVEMSVFVVRAFVKMREQLLATVDLAKRLAEVEKELLTHDTALRDLYQKLRPLLLPPPEPARPRIGFSIHESRATYRTRRPLPDFLSSK